MKRILLLLSITVVLVSGAVCQEPEAPIGPSRFPMFSRRYTVKGDGFSVCFPTVLQLPPARFLEKTAKSERNAFSQ